MLVLVFIKDHKRLTIGKNNNKVLAKPIKINYIGIRPVKYPLFADKPDFKKKIRNEIYDISERTLSACMHEHYEDTPWREQALYTMDSRNEMLCTY